MSGLSADGYLVARELFQRGVGVVFVLAFVAVVHQWRPLLGDAGLTPARRLLLRTRFRTTPSLFHWRYGDRLAVGLAWVGAALSVAVVAGLPQRAGTIATMAAFLVLWGLYLSYVNVGQTWYAFGWESILLEAGFLAAFLGGHDEPVPWLGLLLVRWLLFRVEFGAGLIKWRGDPCWRALTCLYHHHETQPLPSGLSWWFHHLPRRLHRVEVAANHVTQLALPFLLFLPQPLAGVAGVAVLVTQGLAGAQRQLRVAQPRDHGARDGRVARRLARGTGRRARDAGPSPPTASSTWFVVVVGVVFAGQVVLSRWPVANLLSRDQAMNAAYNPFHLVGTYGAFGSITRDRFEVVLEGTADPDPGDDSDWRAYEFVAKPTDPLRRPGQIAPYHLRLDWLLWFAAMSPDPARQHPWFAALLRHLLVGEPGIRRLLRHDPFHGRAPTAVRARRVHYRFTTPAERRATGAWWHVTPAGAYTAILVAGRDVTPRT